MKEKDITRLDQFRVDPPAAEQFQERLRDDFREQAHRVNAPSLPVEIPLRLVEEEPVAPHSSGYRPKAGKSSKKASGQDD